ncbi:hypothetical protein m4_igs_822 [Acanthamoeba polyphaga mimivirus]|nr:hypothetical protein m4_igs_822 [Acanthamoeba polyphaga mimivirus]
MLLILNLNNTKIIKIMCIDINYIFISINKKCN